MTKECGDNWYENGYFGKLTSDMSKLVQETLSRDLTKEEKVDRIDCLSRLGRDRYKTYLALKKKRWPQKQEKLKRSNPITLKLTLKQSLAYENDYTTT